MSCIIGDERGQKENEWFKGRDDLTFLTGMTLRMGVTIFQVSDLLQYISLTRQIIYE